MEDTIPLINHAWAFFLVNHACANQINLGSTAGNVVCTCMVWWFLKLTAITDTKARTGHLNQNALNKENSVF